MTEQSQNPNGQEVKREIPNQHLADRIAGKVDEKGIEVVESKTETVAVIAGVPNQHLSDKIAGKVDHNNVPIESETQDVVSVDSESVEGNDPNVESESVEGNNSSDSSVESELADVPDELPTHLGGIELENVAEQVESDVVETKAEGEVSSEEVASGDANTQKIDEPKESK